MKNMSNHKPKYAEDLPYWKTGQSADKAITEAKNAIVKAGGKVTAEAFGISNGVGAYVLQFTLDGDEFRFTEPVMRSIKGNERAAKVQAAASLKHSIKARVNEAVRHGARRAFLGSLILPSGQTVNQQSNAELAQLFSGSLQLAAGDEDIIDQ